MLCHNNSYLTLALILFFFYNNSKLDKKIRTIPAKLISMYKMAILNNYSYFT